MEGVAVSASGLPTNLEHQFTRVPNVLKPRSTFDRSSTHKTTISVNYWYPIYNDEVLPGDTFQINAKVLCRVLAPLHAPIMDNIYLDWIAIYCPNRILWDNFVKQQGEQVNPGDSIDYNTPQVTNPGPGGWPQGSIGDYLGVATQVPNFTVSAYLFRMYNKFFN